MDLTLTEPFQESGSDPRMIRVCVRILALLCTLMLGGGLQTISNMSRAGLWVCLMTMWLMVFIIGLRLPIRRLLVPVMPFVTWMLCYYTWGVIVSSIPVFMLAVKLAFYFFLTLGTLLVLTSNREYLGIFATYVQWALVLNLIVTVVLINRPEYARYLADPGASGYTDKILESDRFSGLWGNANQAGYAALVMIILSVWAKPVIGWIGRASSLTIIFLTASKQASWLLFMVIVLFVVLVVIRTPKGRAIGFSVGLLFTMALPFIDASMAKGLANDPRVARVLDVGESQAKAAGGESRKDLVKLWLPKILHGPWYGFGLAAMAGSDTPMTVMRYDVPYSGIHNLYLGLWADAGILGLASFLGVVGWQVFKTFRRRYPPMVQWGLVALILVVLGDSVVKHSLIYDMDGVASYLMIFLLPMSPALVDQG